MAGNEEGKAENVDSFRDMHLKEETEERPVVDMDTIPAAAALKRDSLSASASGHNTPHSAKRESRSPVKSNHKSGSPFIKGDGEEMVGGEVTLKLEPGKPPKLSRSTSHKVEKRPPPLFFDHEDRTSEATSTFSVLDHCSYANKYLGTTEHALECDCAEEWGKLTHYSAVSARMF